MRKGICFLYIYIICISTWGQGLLNSSLFELRKLNAYTRSEGELISFTKNPSCLANLSASGFDIFSERKYLMNELNYYSLVFALQSVSGGLGFQGEYAGLSGYSEFRLAAAYGRKLASGIDAGLKLSVNQLKISDYGSTMGFFANAGAICHLTDEVRFGISVDQPIKRLFGEQKTERWPLSWSVGFGYDASQKIFTGLDIGKTEGEEVDVRISCRYTISDKIILMAGLCSQNTIVGLCINYELKSLVIRGGSSYHQVLGVSPSLGITMKFKKGRR